MPKTLVRSTLLLVLVLYGAQPAAAQNREHQQMSAELRMLQEQTQQLALTLAQLNEALKALNARIDASDQQAQKRAADQALLLKGLATDLNAIRERTQDTDTRLRSLSDEIEALRSSITSLSSFSQAPQPGPTGPATTDPNTPSTATPPQPASSTASTVGLSPSRMLESAKGDYFAGSYSSAISGFEALLKAFPKTEAAAEAQYWLGETYYQLKRWLDAANAYTAVVQNYPKSSSASEALYKRGRAQELLGQPEAARASYEQLLKTYPETAQAGLAKQALDRMGRSATAPARP
jgi:tol-pal system protein YbgF